MSKKVLESFKSKYFFFKFTFLLLFTKKNKTVYTVRFVNGDGYKCMFIVFFNMYMCDFIIYNLS